MKQLNNKLSDLSYITGWDSDTFRLFNNIIEDCRMCGRCRKCSKNSKPYRSLFLLALNDAKKVLTAGMSTNEWLDKFDMMYYGHANQECPTYDERISKESFSLMISHFEQSVIEGKYDHLSDEEFDDILLDAFDQCFG